MIKYIKGNVIEVIVLTMLTISLSYTGVLLLEDIKSSRERVISHKDVVCTGSIVLSGSGVVYKDNSTYTLAGKTYQMKDGETCWINDSYMNVEVKQ